MYDAVQTYRYLLMLLAGMPDESDDAENLRSVMDTIWYRMTDEQRLRADPSAMCEDRFEEQHEPTSA